MGRLGRRGAGAGYNLSAVLIQPPLSRVLSGPAEWNAETGRGSGVRPTVTGLFGRPPPPGWTVDVAVTSCRDAPGCSRSVQSLIPEVTHQKERPALWFNNNSA